MDPNREWITSRGATKEARKEAEPLSNRAVCTPEFFLDFFNKWDHDNFA
jgi:hypothetical protein